MTKVALITIAVGSLFVCGLGWAASAYKARVTCTFDRNEPLHGEVDGRSVEGWWFDVYKCSDGTERRQLVAGPRG